jgi:hypothetical protein
MGMTEWMLEQQNQVAALRAQGLNAQLVHHWEAGHHMGTWDIEILGPLTTTTGAPVAARTPSTSVVTGVDPSEIANALYGKIIPLSALGLARIGTAGLIFGPYFSSGLASFAVSFGFPANPEGERRVYEISLDSQVVWENAAGNPAGAIGAGFLGDPFECRFYSGTQTQGADPLEAAMFGAEAVAYRPQMMLWFSNLPVAQFDGKVPFVSAKIGDVTGGVIPGDGINLGAALESIAYSPWLEYSSAEFETAGVADIVQAMILTEDQSFLELLRITARVYRTLDILQTDKLRVNDRGSTVTPDVTLHRDHISADGGVQYSRQEEASVPRELELTTIDPDADYVFMPSKASRQLHPVAVTASVAKDSMLLPVAIDAPTRMSLVTYAKYQEDNARKKLSLQTMLFGYALEPGDLFRLVDVANGFDNSEVWKVVESSHGANYINEITAEAILKCAFDFEGDPFASNVIVLLHADSGPAIDDSIYGHTTAIYADATIDTVVKKFGAGSFLFGGTNGRIDVGAGSLAEYQFSPTNASPYTIELWARFATLGVQQILICQNSFAENGWALYTSVANELIYSTSSNKVSFTASTATTGAPLSTGAWQHIAVDKDSSGKVRIYAGGVLRGSSTPADSVIAFPLTYPIMVGADASSLNEFTGNIDDVRITKGASRYGDLYGDASFTPPGAAFPDPA